MITDLVQIQRLGTQKQAENERFRKHLKRHDFVERRFRILAEEIESEIDCTACANCCRKATAKLTARDVDKISRFLRIRPSEFERNYTMLSEEEGMILRRDEEKGCIFLDGNRCSIYEARPHSCEYFPHTVRGEGSIPSRMWQFNDRAIYCPIVYNTLEAWKAEVKFK